MLIGTALSVAGCFDFETAYEDCYAAGNCREPSGPLLVHSIPAAGTNVAGVHDKLTLTFDSRVDPAGFSAVLTPATQLGAPQWNGEGTEVSFPNAPRYADDTAYTVQLSGAGANGLPLKSPTTLSFRTVVDATAPTVVSATPQDGATNVSPNSAPSITFSEPMDVTSVAAGIVVEPADGACSWVMEDSGTRALCTHPTVTFSPDTQYTISVTTAVTDVAGLPVAAPFSYSFTTGATPDTTAPSVVSNLPVNLAVGIDPAQTLTVTFSESMDPTSVQAAIAVTSPGGITPVGFVWSPDHTTVTFSLSPAAALQTDVGWRISTGAKDAAGNPLSAQVTRTYRTWRFVTSTLFSNATLDGEVRKYPSGGELFQGYTSSTVGTSTSQLVRTYLAFDMTAVFANTPLLFQSVSLALWQGTEGTNNPWTTPKGPIIGESIEYGTTLEEADFNVGAIAACPSSDGCPGGAGLTTTIPITNQVQTIYSAHTADVRPFFLQHFAEWDGSAVSPQRYAQFRVRCSTENFSTAAGWTNFKVGESTDGYAASLTVSYYAP